jgi:molybdate transport system substrate-binding protein
VAPGLAARAGSRLACVATFLLVALIGALPVTGQELTVSAAISLRDALEDITPAFEAAHPGVTVNLNLGASGDLQRQIEGGAPVDVFVSAASRNMDVLYNRGAIDPRTQRDVACNKLVVVTPAQRGGDMRELEDLAGGGRIAIGNPRTVPAGQYAREALESAGLWDKLQRSLVYAENVRQALEYVARGETDAGFVYRTDVNAVAGMVRIAFEVDPTTYNAIVYPAAVVAGSRQRRLAREFVDFLVTPTATAAFRDRGFLLPPCKGR